MNTEKKNMAIACLDLEGVLVPEIWISVAQKTGIDDLLLTTRDIADYDELMLHRLQILNKHNLTIHDIQQVIQNLTPLPGALAFLDWLREQTQVIILSDTFQEFALPLMRQLKMPTIFCHNLQINEQGQITNYQLRLKNHKSKAVAAFQQLNFFTIAAGDSYNDTSMLKQADQGIFFCPPESITKEFPEFPVTDNYEQLKQTLSSFISQ